MRGGPSPSLEYLLLGVHAVALRSLFTQLFQRGIGSEETSTTPNTTPTPTATTAAVTMTMTGHGMDVATIQIEKATAPNATVVVGVGGVHVDGWYG